MCRHLLWQVLRREDGSRTEPLALDVLGEVCTGNDILGQVVECSGIFRQLLSLSIALQTKENSAAYRLGLDWSSSAPKVSFLSRPYLNSARSS